MHVEDSYFSLFRDRCNKFYLEYLQKYAVCRGISASPSMAVCIVKFVLLLCHCPRVEALSKFYACKFQIVASSSFLVSIGLIDEYSTEDFARKE